MTQRNNGQLVIHIAVKIANQFCVLIEAVGAVR